MIPAGNATVTPYPTGGNTSRLWESLRFHLLREACPNSVRSFLLDFLLGPIIRPCTRIAVGFIAIPTFRALRRKVANQKDWDREFEKDVEQWFRASLLLFAATRNFEAWLAHLLAVRFEHDISNTWITAGRVLLAMGVIEAMPDQQLFSLIHPGPRPLTFDRTLSVWQNIRVQVGPFLKGVLCQHLNRSSPMLAILAVFFGGTVGWICYFLAIAQYLVIGLVTSRDKALDVLSEYDQQMALRREVLIEELEESRKEDAEGSANAGTAPSAGEQVIPSRP